MSGLYLIAGWLIGIVLNRLSCVLPGYFANGQTPLPRAPASALVQLIVAWAQRGDQKNPIDRIALGAELTTALVFAMIGAQSLPMGTRVWLVLLSAFFILIALIDLRHRLILNALVFPAMGLVLLISIISPNSNIIAVLLGGVFGFAIFALAAYIRPGQLGGGDVKLAVMIGLTFGFPHALWALLIGILAGGLVSITLLLRRQGNAQTEIPYAPFLSFGALAALFYNPIPFVIYQITGH